MSFFNVHDSVIVFTLPGRIKPYLSHLLQEFEHRSTLGLNKWYLFLFIKR